MSCLPGRVLKRAPLPFSMPRRGPLWRIRAITTSVCLYLAASVVADPARDGKEMPGTQGWWLGTNVLLRIQEGDQTLKIMIAGMPNPVISQGREVVWSLDRPLLDEWNEDVGLQQRQLLGLQLSRDYALSKGRWRGEIYDPETGRWYKSILRAGGSDNIEIRGYLGTPLLGRSVRYQRFDPCLPDALGQYILLPTLQAPVCQAEEGR